MLVFGFQLKDKDKKIGFDLSFCYGFMKKKS